MCKKSSATHRAAVVLLRLLLLLTPVVLSNSLVTRHTLPQFAVLLILSSILLGTLTYQFYLHRPKLKVPLFIWVLTGLMLALTLSTLTSINPAISLQGSFTRQMGLVTYLCFFTASIGLAVYTDSSNYTGTVWTIVVAGASVTLYGLAQLAGLLEIGLDPLLYLANPRNKQILRVDSTLGHPDFAGNLLLYTLFITLGSLTIAKRTLVKATLLLLSLLSILVILSTGTRGAWLGMVTGLSIYLFLTLVQHYNRRHTLKFVLIVGACIIALVLVVASSKIGTTVAERYQNIIQEEFSGAGRTTLWRLAVAAAKDYWVLGCGLEMYRQASTRYKTEEYVRKTSGISSDDPHNLYLSTLLSSGVVSLVCLIWLIASALLHLWRAIGKPHPLQPLGIGLFGALVAVVVHNFFLFHIVPTGLYFFSLLTLCHLFPSLGLEQKTISHSESPRQGRLIILLCALPFFLSATYVYKLIKADYLALQALKAAHAADVNSVLRYGRACTAIWLYQGDYHLFFAQALETLAVKRNDTDNEKYLRLAIREMERALEVSLEPEFRLLNLAQLHTELREFRQAQQYIDRAMQIDQLNPMVHLVQGGLYLKQGEYEKAIEELNRARARRLHSFFTKRLALMLRQATNGHPQTYPKRKRHALKPQHSPTPTH